MAYTQVATLVDFVAGTTIVSADVDSNFSAIRTVVNGVVTGSNTLSADTISEVTSANGVVVDSVTMKDGGVSGAGNIVMSGTGPHAIGGATAANSALYLRGAHSSASGFCDGVDINHTLSVSAAMEVYGVNVRSSMSTHTSGAHDVVASCRFVEPTITVNGTATVAIAATLYIVNAPTEASTNAAIYVASGNTNVTTLTVRTSQTVPTVTVSTQVEGTTGNGYLDLAGDSAATAKVRMNDTGVVFIGEAAASGNKTHSLATGGAVIINQEGADDVILAFKSSDVATGITSVASFIETDDFYTAGKAWSALGGLAERVIAETTATHGYLMHVYSGAPATSDTSSSLATANWFVAQHDGANALQDMAADSNAFAWGEIDSGSNQLTRMLLKADDGELHLGNSTPVALDDEDDIGAVRALQIARTGGRGIVTEEWERPAYSYDELRRLGVVGEKDDNGEFLIRVQPYLNLHDGAIWQLFKGLVGMRTAVSELLDANPNLEGAAKVRAMLT